MHSNRGRSKRVVGREDERAPILSVMVRCRGRARQDIMPSISSISKLVQIGQSRGEREGETYSRILDSDGWATMYGGGFSEIDLYSRVNCIREHLWQCMKKGGIIYPLVGSSTGHGRG